MLARSLTYAPAAAAGAPWLLAAASIGVCLLLCMRLEDVVRPDGDQH